MKRERQSSTTWRLTLPRTTTADLMGKQSVRATFKLSTGCIEAISIVATQLGIKQKSLFDHLAEDTQALSAIARAITRQDKVRADRVQKTYVISRKTLYSLEEISKSFDAPRDALIEYSVQRLLPIILKEREKHQRRKKMLLAVNAHFEQGRELLYELDQALGGDDPMVERMAAAMGSYETARAHMAAFVERGRILDEFEPEAMGLRAGVRDD